MASLSRIGRQLQENTLSEYRYTSVSTTYSMLSTDTVVHADTSAGAFTLTLPPVVECLGRAVVIKLVAGAGLGAAPNALTITSRLDSARWNGDIQLLRPGQFVVLYSDGEHWNKIYVVGNTAAIASKYIHEMFKQPFSAMGSTNVGTLSGAGGAKNAIRMASGVELVYYAKGTQTITSPGWADPGLELGTMDQTATDGIEIVGASLAGQPYAFTVGSDRAFFARFRVTLSDVSGLGKTAFGFRKVEATQADYNDYNDGAWIDVTAGAIHIFTIKTNAATSDTDTTQTWADTETHVIEVRVDGAGVVTYLIDGVAPTVTAAYTFTSALVITPFIFFLQNTDICDSFKVLELEWGYQA